MTKEDVLAAVQGNGAPAAAAPPPEGATAVPIRGPAATLARFMDESRSIPTATSFRTLPVDVLDARRKELKASGKKLSFTHLIAWAIVKAAADWPVMGHSYAEQDGKPQRVVPGALSLGLAVDVERKDGTRSLVVPVIHGASELDFATFAARYDELVAGARDNKLPPDAYQGANVSLTNPGGLGTVASVPRLMPGQGTIIATGAIGYPPGLTAADPERLRELGVQKVTTMTSTYDHRVIQGAESGSFLRRIDQLLQGEDGFYDEVFHALGLEARVEGTAPAAPVTAHDPVPAAATPAAAPVADAALLQAVQAATSLVKAHRMHGHLAARLDPLGSEPVGDPALDPQTVGSHPRADGAHPGVGAARGGAGRDLRRGAAEPARDLRRARSPTRSSTSPTTSSASGSARRSSPAPTGSRSSRRRSAGCSSGCRASRRSRATSTRPSSGRSSSRSRASTPSCRCSTRRSSWPPAPARARWCSGMAHRGRLNVLAHTIGRPYESILAEFEGEQTLGVETAAPAGGTGDVKYHYGAVGHLPDAGRQGRDGHALAEPEPPRVREPGDRGPHARRPDLAQGARADPRPERGARRADPRRRGLPRARASWPRRSTCSRCRATPPAARCT